MGGMGKTNKAPPGIRLINGFRGKKASFFSYQTLVLILTFFAYVCFHASRKPPSIVKAVLDPDENATLDASATAMGGQNVVNGVNRVGASGGWPPFNGKLGKALLGEIDVAFLACYAVGMYFAGHIGDRVDLRLFLSAGMVGSGFFVCLFGMGYFWGIHRLRFFLAVQMAAGLLQATGWPSVVSIMANWYGKKRRGLIMGVWNAHTSIGNILGSLIASAALAWGWGWAFVLPGLTIMMGGVIVYLFLVVKPEDLGIKLVDVLPPGSSQEIDDPLAAARGPSLGLGENARSGEEEPTPLGLGDGVKGGGEEEEEEGQQQGVEVAVGFLEAWRIPGVASFALCLFFAKLGAPQGDEWGGTSGGGRQRGTQDGDKRRG
eukprot:jgi/Mesen1/6662/ME000340S05826